jgi:hypothetical protein
MRSKVVSDLLVSRCWTVTRLVFYRERNRKEIILLRAWTVKLRGGGLEVFKNTTRIGMGG